MPKLSECRPRNHLMNFAGCPVVANAIGAVCHAEPDSAQSFHPLRKRAIVDQLPPHRIDPANLSERGLADQQAPTSSSRGPMVATRDPARRIKLKEEIHEGGNQRAFGERSAMQFDNHRDESEASCFGASYKVPKTVWRMNDVGIGEEEIVGLQRLGNS